MLDLNLPKLSAMLFALVLVLNLVLFAMDVIDPFIFWSVIVLVALFAFFGLPKIRKDSGKR